MTLVYFATNAAWAFIFHGPNPVHAGSMCRLGNDPLWYRSRAEATEAARFHGLHVGADLKVTARRLSEVF